MCALNVRMTYTFWFVRLWFTEISKEKQSHCEKNARAKERKRFQLLIYHLSGIKMEWCVFCGESSHWKFMQISAEYVEKFTWK